VNIKSSITNKIEKRYNIARVVISSYFYSNNIWLSLLHISNVNTWKKWYNENRYAWIPTRDAHTQVYKMRILYK